MLQAPESSTERLLLFAAGFAAAGESFDGANVAPQNLVSRAEPEARWDAAHRGIDLSRALLYSASLRGANLSFANLNGADLSDIRGAGMSLANALLEGAIIINADLVGADLSQVEAGEADFTGCLLEDATLVEGRLRFAQFSKSILEGSDFTRADLWGANMRQVAGSRAVFKEAKLDEASLADADLNTSDFTGASLRRASLSKAKLRNATFTAANLEGADLTGADLSGAVLPNVSLASCNLRHACFAGAWLERTRLRAQQLADGVGEEVAGNLEAAIDSYMVLERNFQSLGISEDARWAYLRRRRVGKRLHARTCRKAAAARELGPVLRSGLFWLGDTVSEWLCDYGESVLRVARAFLLILICFALLYWITHSLQPRGGIRNTRLWSPIDYLLFSLDSMTTVGTSEVSLTPRNELGVLLSSIQTVIGTILLGLFGFVLGARIRS